eukprot:sb/3472191/
MKTKMSKTGYRSSDLQSLQPSMSGVSDDIWMKTFGNRERGGGIKHHRASLITVTLPWTTCGSRTSWYADSNPSMFDVQKEAEMSVSDPEEYLLSRSDEDVGLFPSHSTVDTRTLNLPQQVTEDQDYVASTVEFSECVDRGLFCREGTSTAGSAAHFHCPCCFKHNEVEFS